MAQGRVLLVDDDPSVLKMTRCRLEHEGYEVVTAADGEEALACFGDPHFSIDLILLDLNLPRLDGLMVCRRLKAYPATSHIPIIIFTASDTLLDRLTDLCVELGAADWIEKPFRSQELLEKIRAACQQARPARYRLRALEKRRVLVVDDDPETRAVFAQALAAVGASVVIASNGREAVAAVKEAPCALAVVDVVMPEMDGLETLQALRAAQPLLPVVMMTGHNVEDLVQLALELGAIDCLYKPFVQPADALRAIATRVLEHSSGFGE